MPPRSVDPVVAQIVSRFLEGDRVAQVLLFVKCREVLLSAEAAQFLENLLLKATRVGDGKL